MQGRDLDAALKWLMTYAKLREDDAYMIVSAAMDKCGPGELELFIYWVKVLGLSHAGVKRPELLIRNPYTRGGPRWRLTWY